MNEISLRTSGSYPDIRLLPSTDESLSSSSMKEERVPLYFYNINDSEASIEDHTIGKIVIKRNKFSCKSKSENKLSSRINLDSDTLDFYFSKLNINDKPSNLEPRKVKIRKESSVKGVEKIQKKSKKLKRTKTTNKTSKTATKVGVKKKRKNSSSSPRSNLFLDPNYNRSKSTHTKKNKKRARSFRDLNYISDDNSPSKKTTHKKRERSKSSRELPRLQLESDLKKKYFIKEEQSTSFRKPKQEKILENTQSSKKAKQKNRVRSRSRDSRYSKNVPSPAATNGKEKLEKNPYKFHSREIIESSHFENNYTVKGTSKKDRVQGYLYEGNLHCLKYNPNSGTIYSTAIAIFLADQGIHLSMKDIKMPQEELLSMAPNHLKKHYSIDCLKKTARVIQKLKEHIESYGSALIILDNKGYPHPIFIDEINSDTVLVRDPGDGKRKLITYEALEKRWQSTLAIFRSQ